jgi:hypothetical protein
MNCSRLALIWAKILGAEDGTFPVPKQWRQSSLETNCMLSASQKGQSTMFAGIRDSRGEDEVEDPWVGSQVFSQDDGCLVRHFGAILPWLRQSVINSRYQISYRGVS